MNSQTPEGWKARPTWTGSPNQGSGIGCTRQPALSPTALPRPHLRSSKYTRRKAAMDDATEKWSGEFTTGFRR